MSAGVELDVAQHVEACGAGAGGGGGSKSTDTHARVRCRHCGARFASRGYNLHLGRCPSLPEEDRRALDESEVARAAAGAGKYGSNPVYRGFQVTGWMAAQCKACQETVRGGSSQLERHKEGRCRGFRLRARKVDVVSHFSEGDVAGESECLHCGVVVRGHTSALKQHMAACRRLPEEHRCALDESEVAKAEAAVGVYGSNPAYRGFQVTGWLVARCKACLETVRGNTRSLQRHQKRGCRGFPATWAEVDVASHFSAGKGAEEWECHHCRVVVLGHVSQLKQHWAGCRRLPKEHRRALDESEVAKAAARAAMYGNPVYRGFQVTGWHVAQCKACLQTIRGGSTCLERHKKGSCQGFPATWREVDVDCHFSEGKGADEWECLHCGAVLRGHVGHRKKHMRFCTRLPEEHRRALDKSEVAKAVAGAGMYGSNPVYRGFQVTGWLMARCKACLETVRGYADGLSRHKDAMCRGFPATWAEVDVMSHFSEGKATGGRECLHCGVVVRRDQSVCKQHMAACGKLPEEHRRALDESEVAKAAAGVGMYGSHPAYRDFQVTGWLVAQCKACLTTLRGGSNILKKHKERVCRGFAATWVEVDVASHFREGEGAGESQCQHCGAVLRGCTANLKGHMGICRRLPEETRRALDESEVAKAAAGAGKFGRNPVYRGFQVTGFLVARCQACLMTVRGNAKTLRVHKERCAGPGHTKRRRVSLQRDGEATPASAQARRPTTGGLVTDSRRTPSHAKHGAASPVCASTARGGAQPKVKPAAGPPVAAGTAGDGGCAASASITVSAAPAVRRSEALRGAGTKHESGAAAVCATSRAGGGAQAGATVAPRAAAAATAAGGADGADDRASDARHRWASDVRATRGSEAVVAAMRARYARLYGVNGSG